MVGVPGRSKGCNTCIRRKIKCDLGSPECQNCRKSCRTCTGYKRKLTFVLSSDVPAVEDLARHRSDGASGLTVHGRWRKQIEAVETGSDPTSPAQSKTAVDFPEQGPEPKPKPKPKPKPRSRPSRRWKPRQETAMSSADLVQVRQMPAHAAFRQQFINYFLSYTYPDELLRLAACQPDLVARHWLLQIPDLRITQPALETAIQALCAAGVAGETGNTALRHHSRELYAVALGQLRHALASPTARAADQTLTACFALSTWELLECPDGIQTAWVSHQNGVAAMLQMRGPDTYGSPLALAVFSTLRLRQMFLDLDRRLPSFVSHPAWLEQPWRGSVTHKDRFERLEDLLIELAGMFRQHDEARRETDVDAHRRRILDTIARCWELDAALERWFAVFEQEHAGPLYSVELAQPRAGETAAAGNDAGSTAIAAVFPVAFHFPSFPLGRGMVLYWVGLTLLYIHLCGMYADLVNLESQKRQPWHGEPVVLRDYSASSVLASLPPLQHRADWPRTAARNVCQSAEYFLQPRMRRYGPTMIFPCLVAVRDCFANALWMGDWTAEVCWITDVMSEIQQRGPSLAHPYGHRIKIYDVPKGIP